MKGSRTSVIIISLTLFAGFMACWLLAGTPATANSNDPILQSLEESYAASANNANLAHENTVRAQELEIELEAHACLDWKATAYYKLANDIPMVNQMTMEEIDAVNCNAVGL